MTLIEPVSVGTGSPAATGMGSMKSASGAASAG